MDGTAWEGRELDPAGFRYNSGGGRADPYHGPATGPGVFGWDWLPGTTIPGVRCSIFEMSPADINGKTMLTGPDSVPSAFGNWSELV